MKVSMKRSLQTRELAIHEIDTNSHCPMGQGLEAL